MSARRALAFFILTTLGGFSVQHDARAETADLIEAVDNFSNGRFAEAVDVFQEQASENSSLAFYYLSKAHRNGQGVAKDVEVALELLEKSALLGLPEAQFDLADEYARGEATEQNLDKAIEWHNRAIDQNYAPSRTELGRLYMRFPGALRSYEKAFQLLKTAAEEGDGNAMYHLGNLLRNEEAKAYFDPVKALQWQTLAIEAGSIGGLLSAASAYDKGLGTTANQPKATELYLLAADRGSWLGAFASANRLYEGIGIAKDSTRAAAYYTRVVGVHREMFLRTASGKFQLRHALTQLGRIHLNGEIQDSSLSDARTFLTLALDLGSIAARDLLEKVKTAETATRISDAADNAKPTEMLTLAAKLMDKASPSYDPAKGAQILNEASALGSAQAAVRLAEYMSRLNDFQAAAHHYEQASKLGHQDIDIELGRMYILQDTPESVAKAVQVFQATIESSNSSKAAAASLELARLLMYGGAGHKQNRAAAVEQLKLAGNAGNAEAQLWLGDLYVKNDGFLDTNASKAKKWYELAANGDNESLAKIAHKLLADM